MDSPWIREIELGDGVLLRAVEPADAESILGTIRRNYEHLKTFMEWVKPEHSIADVNDWIERTIAARRDRSGMNFGIFRDGRFIGSIGMDVFDLGPRATEIGYWIDVDEQGKGIITRGTTALIDIAFSELEMNRMQIRCATANGRSSAVPERLGFIKEGIQRQAIIRDGKIYDFAIYGLLAAEWNGENV